MVMSQRPLSSPVFPLCVRTRHKTLRNGGALVNSLASERSLKHASSPE